MPIDPSIVVDVYITPSAARVDDRKYAVIGVSSVAGAVNQDIVKYVPVTLLAPIQDGPNGGAAHILDDVIGPGVIVYAAVTRSISKPELPMICRRGNWIVPEVIEVEHVRVTPGRIDAIGAAIVQVVMLKQEVVGAIADVKRVLVAIGDVDF